jgi:hypothetical protein
MRTFFYALCIVVATALVSGGVIYGILDYAASTYDDSGKSYVNGNIHAIIDNWSIDELTQRESDEFRQATSDAELASLFAQYKRLGAAKDYAGCTGHASIETTKNGLRTTATYVATATFAHGPAEIKISLIQTKGEWQILGFRVSSPIF